jgi:hypothetical protein
MAKHYNPSITEDAYRIFNTKMSDNIGIEVNPIIQPVVEIKRNCDIVKSIATGQTSNTIYTTPTDKDFYLVGATLSLIKDATATSTLSALKVYINGVQTTLMQIPGLTLTAQSQSMAFSFPEIKIDRNTAITITNTTNISNIYLSGTIIGYTIETIKGV